MGLERVRPRIGHVAARGGSRGRHRQLRLLRFDCAARGALLCRRGEWAAAFTSAVTTAAVTSTFTPTSVSAAAVSSSVAAASVSATTLTASVTSAALAAAALAPTTLPTPPPPPPFPPAAPPLPNFSDSLPRSASPAYFMELH